ncbi:MAG: hypothetical protein ABJH45_14745 [Paracoccaceae bacterium]
MSLETRSFEVYGSTIEVHAGGRRVWPPSFKRFVKHKLDSGELTVNEVMEKCNASQSLVCKWRADVKASKVRTCAVREKRLFSEIVIEDTERTQPSPTSEILLRGREIEIKLPAAYPVDDLVKVILSLEERT